MSRARRSQDDDSDEDQVLYLDYDQAAGEESSVAIESRSSVKDKKLPKYKPLFQHKKYKGDLEEAKYDVNSSPGFAWPIVAQKEAFEKDPSQQDEFNFGKFAAKTYDQADLSTSFHDEHDAYEHASSPIHSATPKGASTSRFGGSSTTPSGMGVSEHAPRSSSAVSVHAQNGKAQLDVAGDRPAHWGSRRPAVARNARSDNNTNKPTAVKSAGAITKPRVVQMAKPKPLPTQAVAPALDGLKLSFKPSWMASAASTSSSNHAQTSQASQTRPGGRSAASVLATEDIQEDAAPPVRALTGPVSSSTQRVQGSGGLQSSFGSPTAAPARSLTLHSGGGWASPHGDFGDYSGAATGGYTAGGATAAHFTSSGSRSSAKAKPGTLKAKLQKLFRDLDAAENRIINVPVDTKSRAVDLQDPRHRAASYVDAEVAQVLPDKVPFRVLQLCVNNVWQKAEATQAAAATEEGCKPNIGELIVGYFKPDTCVGANRTPAEGMVMRVYDPHFLRSNGATSAVFGEDSSVTCAMINTNCWEAVGEVA